MLPKKATLTAYAAVLCFALSGTRVEGRNASILVFGRSGSGVSSTARMLLGSCHPQEPTNTDSSNSSAKSVITEYRVPIPGDSPSFLKIVDIDGVTHDRLPGEDAYIQASLKKYLTHPEGLNSEVPTAVLIVSRFDDTRYNVPQSLYVKTLKRIVEVEKSVFGNEVPDVNILLFTRLMTEADSVQRSPRKKLAILKSAAIEFVGGISPNIAALVGENKGEDFGLTLNEDGTYRLPNRQFYPSNVFEAVANLAENNGAFADASIVDSFAALRSKDEQIKASRVHFKIAPDSKDINFFIRTIDGSGMGDIEDNEVNAALQKTYEEFTDDNIKRRTATTVFRLQAFLQSKNITLISDLPSTERDQVKLFQSLPVGIHKDVVHLLQEALNLTMLPFAQSFTVGHGYDLLKDEILPYDSVPFSPMARNTWKFSELGYLIPTFLSCDKLPTNQIHPYAYFADTVNQSVVQRQTYLEYPNKDPFNISNFAGQIRLGFNVRPRKDDIPALSAVKEIRTHRIRLSDQAELSEDFKDSVELLTPFDSSDRNSEREWKRFFERWGTHVVTSGFVGGFVQGTLISDDITAAYENETQLANALGQIVNFTQVEMDGFTFYGVFGGDRDPKLANVHELPAEEKIEVVDKWESSLSYEPVVLSYEMGLMPVSVLIGRVNETMGPPAETALDLFLQGNLKYRRVRSKTYTGPPTTKQPRPATTSTPTKTSSPYFSSASHSTPLATISQVEGNVSGDPDQSEIARRVSKWAASNRHNSISLDAYLKESAIQRENERKAHEETMRKHRDRLEERQRQRQALHDFVRKAEEERQQDRENAAKTHQLEMELLESRRNQELMELERQLNEAKLILGKSAERNRSV